MTSWRIRVFTLVLIMFLQACTTLAITGSGRQDSSDGRTTALRDRDAKITNLINSAFVRDTLVSATGIRVRTYDGVVTLNGTVDSERSRQRALTITRGTPGVREIRDNLRVQ